MLAAFGQLATVGVPEVVILTVIVQLVCTLVMVRLATTMLPLPAVAVTVPPAQVPPTTDGVAITRPAGRVSVKL